MTNKRILIEEYSYSKTDGSGQRCINCKYINCKKLRNKGKVVRMQCTELTGYLGKNVYVGYNNICDLYTKGNTAS